MFSLCFYVLPFITIPSGSLYPPIYLCSCTLSAPVHCFSFIDICTQLDFFTPYFFAINLGICKSLLSILGYLRNVVICMVLSLPLISSSKTHFLNLKAPSSMTITITFMFLLPFFLFGKIQVLYFFTLSFLYTYNSIVKQNLFQTSSFSLLNITRSLFLAGIGKYVYLSMSLKI